MKNSLQAVMLFFSVMGARILLALVIGAMAILAMIILPGCTSTPGGGLDIDLTDPASYRYQNTETRIDGTTKTCIVTADTDRDLAAGIGMDIDGATCDVNIRAGKVESQNISDVIESVPAQLIPQIGR